MSRIKYVAILFLMIGVGCQEANVEELKKAENPTKRIAEELTKAEDLTMSVVETPNNTREFTGSTSLFATFFEEATVTQLNKIKEEYETGIKDGFSFPILGEAYKYNSSMFRTDILNDIPYTLTFPYNGKFDLTKHEERVKSMGFFSKKCGFGDKQTDEIIHYWCLSLDETFFSYLDELGKDNEFIKNFAEGYQRSKGITNEMKQRLIWLDEMTIDFNNYDHQVFYMLFHVLINEERIAYEKVK